MKKSTIAWLLVPALAVVAIAVLGPYLKEEDKPLPASGTKESHEVQEDDLRVTAAVEGGDLHSDQAPVAGSEQAAKAEAPQTRADINRSNGEARSAAQVLVSGSPEEVIQNGRSLQECLYSEMGEDYVQRSLDKIPVERNWSRFSLVTRMGSMKFENKEHYEAYLWDMHDRCEELLELIDENTREDLLLAARSGNAFARFLYAMWPPEISYDRPSAWLDYQQNALDLTWSNIRRGEPLGMLAMGLSYLQSGRAPLFTPHNKQLGQVFLVAADKCGLSLPWLNREIDAVVDRLDQVDRTTGTSNMLQNLNQSSDELSSLYCP